MHTKFDFICKKLHLVGDQTTSRAKCDADFIRHNFSYRKNLGFPFKIVTILTKIGAIMDFCFNDKSVIKQGIVKLLMPSYMFPWSRNTKAVL